MYNINIYINMGIYICIYVDNRIFAVVKTSIAEK